LAIYTKTGDQGQTGLLGNKRVRKDDLRVEIYGTVDEANSALGLASNLCQVSLLKEISREIQTKLLAVGAELADVSEKGLVTPCSDYDVEKLEKYIDQLEELKPPQKSLILPGGTSAAGAFDLARTIIRRAERRLITFAAENEVNPCLIKYLNRLSDLLFVMARLDEHEELVKRVVTEVKKNMSCPVKEKLLELAKKLAEAAGEHAKKIGVPMVIAVVDKGGNLILCHRMDDSLLASLDIAVNKAYTAMAVRVPTHQLAELAQPGQSLYGFEATNQGRIVIFGGGYPLKIDGQLIGGLGISGGTVEEDMEVAEAAIRKVIDE